MAILLAQLLVKVPVAIISGAAIDQFKTQVLRFMAESAGPLELARFYILPVNGSGMYSYVDGNWKAIYDNALTAGEFAQIKEAIERMVTAYRDFFPEDPAEIFGEQMENRGSQVTFSALGQKAPIEKKKRWDADHKKRDKMAAFLRPLIPEFEVSIGGTTSLDITKKGYNKARAILGLAQRFNLSKKDILYVGDSIFVGGNDYGAVEAGVNTHPVKTVADTKKLIRRIIG